MMDILEKHVDDLKQLSKIKTVLITRLHLKSQFNANTAKANGANANDASGVQDDNSGATSQGFSYV